MPVHQHSRVDDDDDLDDLDDVLEQFAPPAKQTSPPPSSASASTSAQPVADVDEALMNEFAEEMASLFKGFGIQPRADSEGVAEGERSAVAWEAMLAENMDAMLSSSNARTSGDAPSTGRKEEDFQSRVRSTMNKLKESESDLKSSDPSANGGGETFDSLMSQFKDLGDLSGEGPESEAQLQGVLEAMMGQLMSKDVLYEPLKELHDKFPGYLTEHSSTISPEDRKGFEAQISCIKRLLDEFEAKSFRDDDDEARGRIVELMTELQTHGSPPEEIMGPLPPGFNLGADGLPEMPDGCNVH